MSVKKVIFIGLLLLILEGIVGYFYISSLQKQPSSWEKEATRTLPSTPPSPIAEIPKASLSLKTAKTSLKTGETFQVDVTLNTYSTQATAADLTLKYDPQILRLEASSAAQPFKNSPIFQRTVFNELDAKQGLATMSAVSDLGNFFQGNNILTSAVFKALKVGPTEITIVFTPGETRDTNIVSETKDILGSVENLSIDIQP